MNIEIKRVNQNFTDLPLPYYASTGAAGMDIVAAVEESTIIEPGKIVLVPTNLSVAVPKGYECQIRSRSGLAAKFGIFAINSPGTVDSDFRGEVKVILANFGNSSFKIDRGDRIAQMVVAKYEEVNWIESDDLDKTSRGEGGFGSTGIKSE